MKIAPPIPEKIALSLFPWDVLMPASREHTRPPVVKRLADHLFAKILEIPVGVLECTFNVRFSFIGS